LEQQFSIAYGVSEACARGLFETTSEKYRPRSSLDFGPFWEMVERANAHRHVLVAAAERWGIDWRMLAAIGVRESGFRNIAQLGGGLGRGIFQINIKANAGEVTEDQAFDLEFAANWAAKTLARNAETLAASYGLGGERLWTLVIASYNAGIGKVLGAIDSWLARGGTIDQIASLDYLTTRGNYARNVMDLMECFR
jgi:membrane-bound lytic murein transglycosylase MltF